MSQHLRPILLILIVASLLSACAAPIRTLTKDQLVKRVGEYSRQYNQDLERIDQKRKARIEFEYRQSVETGEPNTYDILVLSGGGELGAFGAGFLQGWGEVTQQEKQRPLFDSVSGVSTGALIAPFAFVGTDESYSQIVELYRNPDPNMVIARLLVSLLAANSAVYDASKLHEQIKQGISAGLVSQIIERSNMNKVLLVGATNLDYGAMRVWDLGEIASNNSITQAQEKITERLIASSAIPGAFPPVFINDNLYVDGGASMQVVSGIDDRSWLYEDIQVEQSEVDGKVIVRVWLIINNKLVLEPEVTRPTWDAIAARSLVSLMRGSTLQTIQDVETFVQLINKRPEFDTQMNYVSIPQAYEIPDTINLFDRDKMRDLVELGRKMGRDPSSWKQRAIRPGASILDLD